MASRSSMTLEELVKQLTQMYGTGLRSVVLYGSAASGEDVKGKSDQNVLVIVDRLDRTRLQQLAQTTRAWIDAGNPPPLTLTHAEWLRSADIFPMEYADILERHRILHGENPLGGIRVAPRDLRLQVEHEAMGKLLKLRAGVMSAGTDAKQQNALM
ncbi:MAG: nucleotidyltransferase domain-containing protein, partial [Gemmatimonadaceae bacterium]